MKTRLENLVYEAGERIKELQKRSDKLNEEWHQVDRDRAKYAGDIAGGSTFQSDKKNLGETAEKAKGLIEQLDRTRADIVAQQQYISTLNQQYLDLVRAEKGLPPPQSQYTSNTMYAK